jgi:glutamate racemase
MKDARAPIGVFDSGVGGLSVLRAAWDELPEETFLYLADQAHVPYGPRPLEEVRGFAEGITRFLIDQGARLIVVACNAASAAALHWLRGSFPDILFVGMEPAVKPAAEKTQSGVVGVLATPATFQGELYASVVERFAGEVKLLQHTCPGLVREIEAGYLDSAQTRSILEEALLPMVEQGIDTVVLGCTHYPFIIPMIQEITGEGVRVIDPAPAVARQARRLLGESYPAHTQEAHSGNPSGAARTRFFTSGDPGRFEALLPHLTGESASARSVTWQGKRLVFDAIAE